jgi:enediyne polyketide synthase
MTDPIAIVGMACVYPDVRSPAELWENVLAGRRAFRRLPPERLWVDDYFSPDRAAPDRTYAVQAALIEGYEFDRVAFKVAGEMYRAADPAHWLALDVAARALRDAGFEGGRGLPVDATGVLIGNTLTGEFSRAEALRLRWPYVRRVVEASLAGEGWPDARRRSFLDGLESQYKSPFSPVGAETLAGGLSNTIAGRICNHFDLKGGGYTVDGACASSLLAVAQGCSALAAGDLDAVLAGGVDLSLDPFELVGFAKAGALAPEAMRVYDARPAGFWPGEGCGIVVLMRLADAEAEGRRVLAVVRGWGVSSDGRGGITRPEADGQLIALRRAYRRAGFGIGSVSYFEGHGTGTGAGDAAEIVALTRALREASPGGPPAAIGSVKAVIGHTKAAAGVAGLIKAAMALRHQVVPPTVGCETPRSELTGASRALRAPADGEPWPAGRPLRAGVGAMGFGGINVHLALEWSAERRRIALGPGELALLSSAQDVELLLLDAADVAGLRGRVEHLRSIAGRLSIAEMGDLAAELQRSLGDGVAPVRAALVAARPDELAGRLETLRGWLDDGVVMRIDPGAGVFLGSGRDAPRIGLLFPGQGSPVYRDGGALGHRFPAVRELCRGVGLFDEGGAPATEVAQPAIVAASLAALRALDLFGIAAVVGVGHSLGELTALHWASAFDAGALRRIVAARGRAMNGLADTGGAMASLAAGEGEAVELMAGTMAVIAGLNSGRQTVVSGPEPEVGKVVERARARGIAAARLPVSHAFHSPLVGAAAGALGEAMAREEFRPLSRRVASTVTGSLLAPDEDLRDLLRRQVTSPVRFREALAAASGGIDLWIEAGPGAVLAGLVAGSTSPQAPVVTMDTGNRSLSGPLSVVGAAYALGAPVAHNALFAGRFTRAFDLDWRPRFFASPCERAPVPGPSCDPVAEPTRPPEHAGLPEDRPRPRGSGETLDFVRELVASRTELPASSVGADSRLLADLHLNSISVGELVAEAARSLGIPAPASPTDLAGATVAEVAQALDGIAGAGGTLAASGTRQPVDGVDSWVRAFEVARVERPCAGQRPDPGPGVWRVIAPPSHPLAGPLADALDGRVAGRGVVVCLPPDPDERCAGLLLEGAHSVLTRGEGGRFVLVQHGSGASAFAKSLHLEDTRVRCRVVDVPLGHPRAVEWVTLEVSGSAGYAEAHYDPDGRRWELVLRPLKLDDESSDGDLGARDVLLVTGGGKGIAAECTFDLATATGVRLALIGRSDPSADAVLSANLARLEAAGVRFLYSPADVTDAGAVREAVHRLEAELGPVTAVIHASGVNVPRPLQALDEEEFLRTLAPKVRGARNVLAAVRPRTLKRFITFGSVIGRTGMRGEAHYAVANEWLVHLTERFRRDHPSCRCLAVEWSAWSGIGMAERLGRVDALARQGVAPIAPERGVALLRGLLFGTLSTSSVVVAGRLGELPTLPVEPRECPRYRFLERPRYHFPGVELVVEATLAPGSDPYVDDHVLGGDRVFPAVMGLEAMAQAAMAAAGSDTPPVF